jgi:hypothetical protein
MIRVYKLTSELGNGHDIDDVDDMQEMICKRLKDVKMSSQWKGVK